MDKTQRMGFICGATPTSVGEDSMDKTQRIRKSMSMQFPMLLTNDTLPPVDGVMLEALLNPKSYPDFTGKYKQYDIIHFKEVCISPERTHFIHAWKSVDDYDGNHDCYVDPSLFSNFKDDDLCYFCSGPLSGGHVVRTACACGAIIHVKCFDRLLKYGLKCVQEGGKLPSIVRACGMCRQPLLGEDFDKQHKVTILAYQHFFRLKVEDHKKCWRELIPILTSMNQVIKFVRKHWRSTTDTNAIVGELLAKLGHGYVMIEEYCNDITSRNFKKYGWYACILALRLHNNSNSLGTHIVPYVCDVIHHHQTKARMLQFGRWHLPIVFNYLFQLINNTTHVYWSQVPAERDKYSLTNESVQRCHVSAQQFVVKILIYLATIDPFALEFLRTSFYLFLLHTAKLRPGEQKEVEQKEVEGMGEVAADENEGEVVEDRYVILLTIPVWKYLGKYLHAISYLTKKEKKELWDKWMDNMKGTGVQVLPSQAGGTNGTDSR